MSAVKAKKNLGQHFLTDLNIAKKITDSLQLRATKDILEIGPGMGVLTRLLLLKDYNSLRVVEIDPEAVGWLQTHFPQLEGKILAADFLKLDIRNYFLSPFAVIGNFPYHISSQIFFRILDYKDLVPEIVCMLQKEVAGRLASGPGSRDYGILSVILQTWYHIEYLFTVPEDVFSPPPKVKSAVIRLTRNDRQALSCDEAFYIKVIKTAFNQRRKMLRNSLRGLLRDEELQYLDILSRRPEQLGVTEFEELTELIANQGYEPK